MTISASLDTSAGSAFAVARDGRIISNGVLPVSGRESDTELLPWLVRTVTDLGLNLADIGEWTVGTGPGSFAGMRVGIALIKGVCAGSGARYRGLPTSLALAMSVTEDLPCGSRIGVLHDARRQQVIYTEYRKAASGLELSAEADVLSPEAVAQAARHCASLVSLHADRLLPLLDEATRAKLVSRDQVDAGHYLELTALPWPETAEAAEASCEPVYVRPPVFVPPQPVRTLDNHS